MSPQLPKVIPNDEAQGHSEEIDVTEIVERIEKLEADRDALIDRCGKIEALLSDVVDSLNADDDISGGDDE